MEHIQLQLHLLSLGHVSPSVITPRNSTSPLLPKKRDFKNISNSCLYYCSGQRTVFGDCKIPLLDKSNKFETFDICSIPVPMKNSKAPDNLPNMVAWYNLEVYSIAVNLEQMRYVLFSKKEQDHSSSPLCHYCEVQSPVYSITSGKLCIAALFVEDEERTEKSCQTIVAPNSILPQASHVINGFWFVASHKLLLLWSFLKKKSKPYM